MRATAIDVHAAITAHPWRTVAVAFAAGAVLGLADRSHLRRVLATTAGAAIAVLRDLAAQRASRSARSWLDGHSRPFAEA